MLVHQKLGRRDISFHVVYSDCLEKPTDSGRGRRPLPLIGGWVGDTEDQAGGKVPIL